MEALAISKADIRTFREDGAVVLRNFLSEDCLGHLERAYAEVRAQVEDTGADRNGTRNLMKADTARCSVHVRHFLRESPLGCTAAAAMGSEHVRLYEDLMFVKETEDGQPTPWHQDSSHWPLLGEHLSSIWVSLEPATFETGAMTMVVGSHKGPLYTPNEGSIPADWLHLVKEEEGGPLPDPTLAPERFPIGCYETVRGDAVLFHPAMLHSAPGKAATAARRTFTFRFFGDDIRWHHRDIIMQDHIRALDHEDGDAVLDPCFPVIWPPAERSI